MSLPVTRASLSEKDKAVLDQHLRDYSVFAIDKRELLDSLYKNGACIFKLFLDEKHDWILDMQLNDMRAPGYKQTYITDKGTFELLEPFNVNTYKGNTFDNQIARFTIDENNFFGVILDDKDHFVIRPAMDFTQNDANEVFIVYKGSDVILKNGNADFISDAIEVPDFDIYENIEENKFRSTINDCANYYLKIATDADYNFYQKKGNNVSNTNNYIISKLNIVEGVYESTLRLKFLILYQNVWTSTSNGYPYTSTNSETLLSDFRNYWNSNMTSGIESKRNIAHLFTGKLLNAGVAGRAYRGQISNSNAYGLSMEDTKIHKIIAHEIGHNLFADDNPTSSSCLCGTSDQSLMCQYLYNENLWFCDESIYEIRYFINLIYSRSVLGLFLSGPLTGTNEYRTVRTIESTQIVNSGTTSYKSGTQIILSSGFHAKSTSQFTAKIEGNLDCIDVSTWPTVACWNRGLQFNVTNATNYNIKVHSLFGQLIYSGSGIITTNPVTVWDAIVPTGYYFITITFSSSLYTETKSYNILVVTSCPNNSPMLSEMESDAINSKTISDNHFDFIVYPNPNDGFFTVQLPNTEDIKPYTVQVINSFGLLISNEECNLKQYIFNRSGLPPGVYYVRITMENRTVGKIVVIK